MGRVEIQEVRGINSPIKYSACLFSFFFFFFFFFFDLSRALVKAEQ